MATKPLAVLSSDQAVNADTSAVANTVVLRDATGGIAAGVIAGTTIQTTGNFQGAASNKSANFTAGAATDYFCDASGGNITVTMPLASANVDVVYWFTKTTSGNTVTLTGVLGTNTISTQYDHLRVVSDGTNWYGRA